MNTSHLACQRRGHRSPDPHPRQQVTHLWLTTLTAVVGFAGNELVARYRIRVGRRIGSPGYRHQGRSRTHGLGPGSARLPGWVRGPIGVEGLAVLAFGFASGWR